MGKSPPAVSGGCRSCGAPVPRKPGPGRPPAYCGPRCARGAEFRVRRLLRKRRRLEAQVREQRMAVRRLGELAAELRYPVGGGTPASRLAGLERRLEVVRRRLRLLRPAPRGSSGRRPRPSPPAEEVS